LKRKKSKWKKLLPQVLWSLAGVALCILLVSAVQRNNQLHCKDVEIAIEGFKNEMFISDADVKALLEEEVGQKLKGCSIEKLDLRKLESVLQKDSWIKQAQLYIDNRQVLHINVSERLPVARIFTVANRSFYVDSEAVALPLSNYEVADVPVFTNVPDRGKIVTPEDSIFWRRLSGIGSYIIRDSFLLLQVGQVSVTPEKELELYPVIGNHVVRFGSPENYELKFDKLSRFYKQVLAKAGLNKYSVIDIRYDKQIVAKLRNATELLPAEPQIQVQEDRVADIVIEAPTQPLVTEKQKEPEIVVKKQKEPEKKKPAERIANQPKKEKPVAQIAKIEKRKPIKEREKTVAASSNKPARKAIEQLPRKVEKPGLIEIDSRQQKRDVESKSSPKAVMPKKQKK